MTGINLATSSITESTRLNRKSLGIKCVFLSHQRADKDVCRNIANYLLAAGIDVYFDEYDTDLKLANQTGNPQLVTNAIRKGINKSSHMLCVVSPNTLNSKWVPFEVGYGYDLTVLGVLTLKGIEENDLPDYIKTAKFIVRGTNSLNEFIAKITNENRSVLESKGLIKSHTAIHPLDNFLDFQL